MIPAQFMIDGKVEYGGAILDTYPITSMTATFEALFRSLDFERPLDVGDPKDQALYVSGMHTTEGVSPVD